MATIDYGRTTRLRTRMGERLADAELSPIVKNVYEDSVRAAVSAYLAANAALGPAETNAKKEVREGAEALLDQPSRQARAVVVDYHPDTSLPETQKSQPTDTDRKHAIASMLDILDDHTGEAWAGEFGQSASRVVQELDEALTANTTLSAARDARAAAYGPAYERYLSRAGTKEESAEGES